MVRTLIIEQHDAVRKALQVRLQSAPAIESAAAVRDLVEGEQIVSISAPDVILIGLPRSRSENLAPVLRAINRLLAAGRSIIILAPYANEVERETFLQLGVARYLLKNIDSEQLIAAIMAVAADPPVSV